MLKDVHLLEAALATDCVVVSSDEKVRHLFSDLSQQVVSVKRVAWVNPTNVLESTIDWLENGTGSEKEKLFQEILFSSLQKNGGIFWDSINNKIVITDLSMSPKVLNDFSKRYSKYKNAVNIGGLDINISTN